MKGETGTTADIEATGREPQFTFWGSEITPIAPETLHLEKEPASDDSRYTP